MIEFFDGRTPDGNVAIRSTDSARSVILSQTKTTHIFKEMLYNASLDLYDAGLFSNGNITSEGKVEFLLLKTKATHGWTAKAGNCTFAPKGLPLTFTNGSFNGCAIKYENVECPTEMFNECLKTIINSDEFGEDILSLPVVRELWDMAIKARFEDLALSFSNMSWQANHPLIDLANTSGAYATNMTEVEWEAYYDQMTSIECKGYFALMDELASMGHKNFANDIPAGYIENGTGRFVGDIEEYLTTVMDAIPGEFGRIVRKGGAMNLTTGARSIPMLLLTRWEYQALWEKLKQCGTCNEITYRLNTTLADGLGIISEASKMLRWRGLNVLPFDPSEVFDSYVGTESHRVLFVMPGNFGLVGSSRLERDPRRPEGFGMKIEQVFTPPSSGQVYMSTALTAGFAIIDPEYCYYAHLIKTNV